MAGQASGSGRTEGKAECAPGAKGCAIAASIANLKRRGEDEIMARHQKRLLRMWADLVPQEEMAKRLGVPYSEMERWAKSARAQGLISDRRSSMLRAARAVQGDKPKPAEEVNPFAGGPGLTPEEIETVKRARANGRSWKWLCAHLQITTIGRRYAEAWRLHRYGETLPMGAAA